MRLWQRTIEQGECRIWTGATRKGRGVISINGRLFYVKRVAWERSRNLSAEGRQVLSSCGKMLCIAPTHLYTVDEVEDLKDEFSQPMGRPRPVLDSLIGLGKRVKKWDRMIARSLGESVERKSSKRNLNLPFV